MSRYAHASAILRDYSRFSSTPPWSTNKDAQPAGSFDFGSDPPRHTRLRNLISRDFTPKRIAELEPRIRTFADEALKSVPKKGEFDVVEDLANVLPVKVIAEVLGISSSDYTMFKEWSDSVVAVGTVIPGAPGPSEAIGSKATVAHTALADYLKGEVEKRRRRPGPDLLSALVAAREESDTLDDKELIQFAILLLIAGNETTTNLIGNGMVALLKHPEQLQLLQRDQNLIPRAIEEMLRFDSPVQATGRFPKHSVEVGGTEIPGGAMVLVINAAANRDPGNFSAPDEFDITREPNDHLSLGQGIHFCIGAPLARLEARIAVGEMIARFPKIRFANSERRLTYKGSYFLRGPARLPVIVSED